jgi:hypothetical protein
LSFDRDSLPIAEGLDGSLQSRLFDELGGFPSSNLNPLALSRFRPIVLLAFYLRRKNIDLAQDKSGRCVG